MNVAVITNAVSNPMNLSAPAADFSEAVPILAEPDADEIGSELGLWLAGLESFLSVHNYLFAEEHRTKAAARDWTKEFRLTHSTLLLCSRLAFQLSRTLKDDDSIEEFDFDFEQESSSKSVEFNAEELYGFSQAVKDSIQINEALLRAAPLKFGEWLAWSSLLTDKLASARLSGKLIESSEKTGERFLPQILRNLLETKPLPLAMKTDLSLILPHFGRILKWLSAVEKMLKNDEPLKPALLLFARIYEQIQELMSFVNNRLLRFSDEEDLMFGLLDGAAYTASIELRKVYQHELAGLAEIRQTPLIYAKTETAYSLLNDSFQQTLVTFAQLIEPNIEPTKLFPNFQSKLQQSQTLRQNLWKIFKTVQEAEKKPEKTQLNSLHRDLGEFLNTTLHYLFYKDMETVERFIEEVLVTTDKKDLVPILHRFGAYLETLFGQVNMRTVLANHPFDNS